MHVFCFVFKMQTTSILLLNFLIRYRHFEMSDRCSLFRVEDYLPPVKAEDVEGHDDLNELEDVLNTKCPRCGKVSRRKFPYALIKALTT